MPRAADDLLDFEPHLHARAPVASPRSASSPRGALPEDAPPTAPSGVAVRPSSPPEGASRAIVTAEAVQLAEPPGDALVFLTAPYSARADAYRAVRRKLGSGASPRLVGVASAREGEGKTTFALNLALALRESARGRVLLCEANHRSPAIARTLGFTVERCFLQQLRDNLEDPSAGFLAVEPVAKLHVLAVDPRAAREPLLDPVAFGRGMERLREAGYDHVVVDSPPVLGSVDCNVIADSVDGMIFTAVTMRSKRREMRKAVLQLDPAPILGVVVLDAV